MENLILKYFSSLCKIKFFIIKLLLGDQFRQDWIIWRLLQFITRPSYHTTIFS